MPENEEANEPLDLDRALTQAEREVWGPFLESAQLVQPSAEFANALEAKLLATPRTNAQPQARGIPSQTMGRPVKPLVLNRGPVLTRGPRFALVGIALGAIIVAFFVFAGLASREVDLVHRPPSDPELAAQFVPLGKVRHIVTSYQSWVASPAVGGSAAPPDYMTRTMWLKNGPDHLLVFGTIERSRGNDTSKVWVTDRNIYDYKYRSNTTDRVYRFPYDPAALKMFLPSADIIAQTLQLPGAKIAGDTTLDGREVIEIASSGNVGPNYSGEEYDWIDKNTYEKVQGTSVETSTQGSIIHVQWKLVVDELKDEKDVPADLFSFKAPNGVEVTDVNMPYNPTPAVAFAQSPTPETVVTTPTPIAAVPRMQISQLQSLLTDAYSGPLVVDVRDANAFNQGHIAGAVSLPEAEVDSREADLPRDKDIVLYDDSPGEAAALQVAEKLQNEYFFDYKWLKVLAGGWNAWKQAGTGYQVATGPAPLPTRTPDAWTGLRARPLNLPALSNGACPVTQGKSIIPGFTPLMGSGPIYPAGIYPGSGTNFTLPPAPDANGLFSGKIIWVGSPDYDGSPVLVRGAQINGPGKVHFQLNVSDPISDELLLDASNRFYSPTMPSGWDNWPTGVYLSGPGCYALQIDNARFSQTIVFEASQGAAATPVSP